MLTLTVNSVLLNTLLEKKVSKLKEIQKPAHLRLILNQ
jgi:hypothetical protein